MRTDECIFDFISFIHGKSICFSNKKTVSMLEIIIQDIPLKVETTIIVIIFQKQITTQLRFIFIKQRSR